MGQMKYNPQSSYMTMVSNSVTGLYSTLKVWSGWANKNTFYNLFSGYVSAQIIHENEFYYYKDRLLKILAKEKDYTYNEIPLSNFS